MTVYMPHPIPAAASPRAREHALAAHLIPPAWWASYGDIGEAVDGNGRGCASSLSSISPLFTGDSYEPGDDDWWWCLPWHRINEDDGRQRSRAAGTFIAERCAFANEVYAAEGGLFIAPGVAHPDRRFDIRRKVAEIKAAGLWLP